MDGCELCNFFNTAEIIHISEKYRIVKSGEFYYSIWHEHCTWGGVRTCKRKIHEMKHETQHELRQIFKPDFVGMDIIDGPHLHFKCWRIAKVK